MTVLTVSCIHICPLKRVFFSVDRVRILHGPSPHFAWTESAFSHGPSSLFGGDRARMGLSSGAIKTGLCYG